MTLQYSPEMAQWAIIMVHGNVLLVPVIGNVTLAEGSIIVVKGFHCTDNPVRARYDIFTGWG